MRLKFEMWKATQPYSGGYVSMFTDGKGRTSTSWRAKPMMSIDHAGPEYLPGRHNNVRTARHDQFIKKRYKEEMIRLRGDI
ncbi:hypothetical protein HUB98_26350 [Paenibacillus barcinonensis]|uniref:Uncharacterized protein n=1 Tax=Paenibacillus barcinonensis TaxID=198119 RepID=A0A2V4VFG9_PAEBA|nr:hypothetical protein [Paenibacillus barcinonensis]PYE52516.1 hypothetical protein DFQ00_101454 [Paenibacillus barcinonensis]QKS59325.1 hypothetical protein HUB98_26060 [Paenibacillus barcinonensis]QKS59379.1 hypothetical protein HUB98_26350 [Paenibacillus barcinonensis]